jgi:GNAT superfamily N-acetyltransferase
LISVRPATAADRELLIAWMAATLEDLKGAAAGDPWFEGVTFPAEAAEAHVEEALADEGPLLIATLDGAPVGYLEGRIELPYVRESPIGRVGHVALVRVVPEARRRGVATALLAAAEAWFKARGLAWLQLSWHPWNEPARATWAAHGFEPFRVFGRKRLA